VEGGNILHHVKWRGIVREGEMSGDMSGEYAQGEGPDSGRQTVSSRKI